MQPDILDLQLIESLDQELLHLHKLAENQGFAARAHHVRNEFLEGL